ANHLKFIIMKKVILSIALMGAVITTASVQQVNAANEVSAVNIVMDDDNGYVEVQLDSLNPAVQASVNALSAEYDVKSLKFNASKQLTKVMLIKKDDQSTKKVYLDAEGNEVPASQHKAEAAEKNRQGETPSVEVFEATQQKEDGFANVKFEDLNEKVQQAVRKLIDKYDINALQYHAEKKITKVTATDKENQSVKTVYFDDEGKEITPEAAPQNTTEAPMLL
ncbi:hypothetical protein, partial [Proteiniphilum sp. UBA1028]|uniref:hypothetical protein n=1 Tax=Proteiniphilum sp. UBA1028 TaxID=1947251 RepID=UPI0025F25273